jgi:putative component of toxin-antitoxin plasmid stabilization module
LLKFLYQLGLIIEKFERTAPRIFWFLSLVFYTVTVFVSPHDAKIPPAQVCQYQVVNEQFRCGGQGEKLSIIRKMAIFFVPNSKRQKPQPQCPAPNLNPNPGPRFTPGSGSGSSSPWGNAGPDPCQRNDIPPRSQWNSDAEIYRYDNNQDKKNEKDGAEEDQASIHGECRPRVLKSRINEDDGLIRAAEKACKNKKVQADINRMEEQLAQGNMNPGIGSRPVGDGIREHRGKNGGRILVRESENNVVEILGKCGKKSADQQFVIDQAKKVFHKNEK